MDSPPLNDTSTEDVTRVIGRLLETSAEETDNIYVLKRIIGHQLDRFSRDDTTLNPITREILELIFERLQHLYSPKLTSILLAPSCTN